MTWFFALCSCQLLSDKITSYRARNMMSPPYWPHATWEAMGCLKVLLGPRYFSMALCFLFGSIKGGPRKFILCQKMGTMYFEFKWGMDLGRNKCLIFRLFVLCVFSLCLCGLIISRYVCEYEWFVSMWICNKLATCPGCHPDSTLWQLGEAPTDP